MQFLAIVALCVAAAVLYGIVHDQITIRICLEYFTIGHPPIFATTSPTLLALAWGVIATWWMGLALGVCVALASRAGSRPVVDARELVRPIGFLLALMALAALLSGSLVAVLASQGRVLLWEPMAFLVPENAHVGFLADLAAHNASYLVGGFGGIVLTYRVWRSRLRRGLAVR